VAGYSETSRVVGNAVKAFSCTPHRGVESEDHRGGRRGLSQRSLRRGDFNVKKG